MDAKPILKNTTRSQGLKLILDLIDGLYNEPDPSGIDSCLEDAHFHMSKAYEEHVSWVNRDRDEEEAIAYVNFRRDMDSE